MINTESKLHKIYLGQMEEVTKRCDAVLVFLDAYKKSNNEMDFDSCVLQLRKALEALAYASIAPNKNAYQAFRSNAEKQNDYKKDYKASSILQALKRINVDFYPLPLIPAIQKGDGTWHYDRKAVDYLTDKRFVKIYDRLGKFLHADNPWDNNKNPQNLVSEIERTINEARELLELHATFIKTPEYKGVWVVCVPKDGSVPSLINAKVDGGFIVNKT
ncbi:hypothetical protein [Thiomicrorhabdus sediminis]|uniref:Uncharacterized protein n=1 Tax=Thiomicrorhabdus sediminis TaxID=2580412 RepID=A0A4P9K5J0_9GAMM|nr:hypothetical protein [Thiomicrorhabdus sediminis]QCU90284.1 hypothetical protein FE785_06400 [Thiomicrorhabdus sediminis]